MDRRTLKRQILEASIRYQTNLLETLQDTSQERIWNMQESATGAATQRFERMLGEEQETLRRQVIQVDFAREQLALLEGMSADPLHDCVQFGSVIHTDLRNFFIATTLTDIEVAGKNYLGLATGSALYQSLKGKRKGDSFLFSDQECRITDVF